MELKRIFLVALVVVLALGLGWVTFLWHPEAGRTPAHRELALAEAPRGGDFVLDSNRGPVALKDLRGHLVDTLPHGTSPQRTVQILRNLLETRDDV